MNHAENERNPGITYERRDLSSRGVLTFLIVLAVAAVLVHVVLWGAYKYVSRHNVQPPLVPATVANDSGTVQPAGNPRATFPAPRLQADPVGDLERFRTAEDAALNSYGWADQANGRVHIPIEQAINLVAQTGLPTRPAALAAADARGKITAGGAAATPISGPGLTGAKPNAP